MAKQYNEITDDLKIFIQQQKIFFVGTADVDGRINISPKGADTFRILGRNRAVLLNLTGSGNETAAHMLAKNRITIMFCSFEDQPKILRLYGHGKIIHHPDKDWNELIALFPEKQGARQLFDLTIDLAQTSCGFQVPFFDYQGERDTLDKWTRKKDLEEGGIEGYWHETNNISIDGKPTDM